MDAKVVYQIVNLRKALIEIDDLVTGLQNRVVIAVQSVVARQTRKTVTDVDGMCDAIRAELEPVEDQWGVRILKFGFSNISLPHHPRDHPARAAHREKRRLYETSAPRAHRGGAVALVSGVVSVHPEDPSPAPPQKAPRGPVEGARTAGGGERDGSAVRSGAADPSEDPFEDERTPRVATRDEDPLTGVFDPSSPRRLYYIGPGARRGAGERRDREERQHGADRPGANRPPVPAGSAPAAPVRGPVHGRVPRQVLEPGFHPMIPFLQQARRVPTLPWTSLPSASPFLGHVFVADANIVYRVDTEGADPGRRPRGG